MRAIFQNRVSSLALDRWMCSQFLLALRSQVGIELAFVGVLERYASGKERVKKKYCTVLAWIQGFFEMLSDMFA